MHSSSGSSHDHHKENLFIDEDFGTPATNTLQIVMDALERLTSVHKSEESELFPMFTKWLNVSRFKSMFIKPEMGKVKSK